MRALNKYCLFIRLALARRHAGARRTPLIHSFCARLASRERETKLPADLKQQEFPLRLVPTFPGKCWFRAYLSRLLLELPYIAAAHDQPSYVPVLDSPFQDTRGWIRHQASANVQVKNDFIVAVQPNIVDRGPQPLFYLVRE